MISDEVFKKYGFNPQNIKIGKTYFNNNGFVVIPDAEKEGLYHLRREEDEFIDVGTFKDIAEYREIATEWLTFYWSRQIENAQSVIVLATRALGMLKDDDYWFKE